jgi:hypothetical protein
MYELVLFEDGAEIARIKDISMHQFGRISAVCKEKNMALGGKRKEVDILNGTTKIYSVLSEYPDGLKTSQLSMKCSTLMFFSESLSKLVKLGVISKEKTGGTGSRPAIIYKIIK